MATLVLGAVRNHFLPQTLSTDAFPETAPTVQTERPTTIKPWGHDCREHRSWRCVWCEGRFCFECDTGTTASLNQYSHHRLCKRHYAELPGQKPSRAYQLHARQFGSSRPFSIDIKYIPTHIFNMPAKQTEMDKIQCRCLMSKTLICRDCAPHAEQWRSQEDELFEKDKSIKCAFGRFPGGCKAKESGQKCSCHGRGVECTYIPDQEWEKMEADDLLWLGVYGTVEGDFKKKEKKDLRSMFGDSFPRQTIDNEPSNDITQSSFRPTTGKLKKRRSERKALSIDIHRRMSRSSIHLPTPKRTLSSPSRMFSISTAGSPEPSLRNTSPKIPFLANPQFRKPYSNFRVSAVAPISPISPRNKRTTRSKSITESFLNLDSDDDEGEDEIEPSPQGVEDCGHPSEQLSFISLSSSNDHFCEDEKVDGNYQLGLAPPPRIIHVATATALSRQTPPRLVHHLNSVPDLKQIAEKNKELRQHGEQEQPGIEISASVLSSADTEKSKWGCQKDVDLSHEHLQTWEAHGFWKCSFCDGRIRGV